MAGKSNPERLLREISLKKEDHILPAVDFLDYLLFPVFITSFFLILIIFELIQRLAYLFGKRAHQVSVSWLNYFLVLCLRIIGVKIEVLNSIPLLNIDSPVIIVSNHQSLFDIPILATLFSRKSPRFVAKKELGLWIPSVSFNLRNGGSALVDRSNPRQAISEIEDLAKRMNEQKFATVIFPEGTRARNGALKKFHSAGANVLIENTKESIIIPVALDNSWKLACRKFGPIQRGVSIKVSILPAIENKGGNSKELINEAYSSIEQELDKIRKVL